jgi:hypothetical protein
MHEIETWDSDGFSIFSFNSTVYKIHTYCLYNSSCGPFNYYPEPLLPLHSVIGDPNAGIRLQTDPQFIFKQYSTKQIILGEILSVTDRVSYNPAFKIMYTCEKYGKIPISYDTKNKSPTSIDFPSPVNTYLNSSKCIVACRPFTG